MTEAIAYRLKQIMTAEHLSLTQAAKLIGISPSSMRKVLKDTPMSRPIMFKINRFIDAHPVDGTDKRSFTIFDSEADEAKQTQAPADKPQRPAKRTNAKATDAKAAPADPKRDAGKDSAAKAEPAKTGTSKAAKAATKAASTKQQAAKADAKAQPAKAAKATETKTADTKADPKAVKPANQGKRQSAKAAETPDTKGQPRAAKAEAPAPQAATKGTQAEGQAPAKATKAQANDPKRGRQAKRNNAKAGQTPEPATTPAADATPATETTQPKSTHRRRGGKGSASEPVTAQPTATTDAPARQPQAAPAQPDTPATQPAKNGRRRNNRNHAAEDAANTHQTKEAAQPTRYERAAQKPQAQAPAATSKDEQRPARNNGQKQDQGKAQAQKQGQKQDQKQSQNQNQGQKQGQKQDQPQHQNQPQGQKQDQGQKQSQPQAQPQPQAPAAKAQPTPSAEPAPAAQPQPTMPEAKPIGVVPVAPKQGRQTIQVFMDESFGGGSDYQRTMSIGATVIDPSNAQALDTFTNTLYPFGWQPGDEVKARGKSSGQIAAMLGRARHPQVQVYAIHSPLSDAGNFSLSFGVMYPYVAAILRIIDAQTALPSKVRVTLDKRSEIDTQQLGMAARMLHAYVKAQTSHDVAFFFRTADSKDTIGVQYSDFVSHAAMFFTKEQMATSGIQRLANIGSQLGDQVTLFAMVGLQKDLLDERPAAVRASSYKHPVLNAADRMFRLATKAASMTQVPDETFMQAKLVITQLLQIVPSSVNGGINKLPFQNWYDMIARATSFLHYTDESLPEFEVDPDAMQIINDALNNIATLLAGGR